MRQGEPVVPVPAADGVRAVPQGQCAGGGGAGEGDVPRAHGVLPHAEGRFLRGGGGDGQGKGAAAADRQHAAGQGQGAAGAAERLQRLIVGGGEVLFPGGETIRQKAEHTGTERLRRGEQGTAGKGGTLRR